MDYITPTEPSGTSSINIIADRNTPNQSKPREIDGPNRLVEPIDDGIKLPARKKPKVSNKTADSDENESSSVNWKEKYFQSIVDTEKTMCNSKVVTSNLKSYNLLLCSIKLEKELGLSEPFINLLRASIDPSLNEYPNCHSEVIVEDPIIIQLDSPNDE